MPTVVGAGLAALAFVLFFLLTSGSAEAQEPPANYLATGAPTISGTAQVRETLTADVAGISDADGLTNPVFTYQWIRNDGTFDSNIQGATSSTYTLDVYDQGKAIKVKVSFTDDRSHEETLTSLATVAVAATTPGAPLKVKVSPYGSGVLCVSWRPPSSTGGSGITGYKLGWKSNDQDYDSSRQESVSVHVTRYCIEGLTNEVEYSVRVIAVNKVGDSTPSAEETATPTDAGICERTPAVRSQILKHVRWVHGEVECADVTDAHLAAVKTYPMVFTARPDDRHTSDYIPLFKPGDFDGLSNLGHLIIRGSDSVDGSFSELPEGLFDDLTGLRRLEMSRLGGLTTLPDGIFDNLTGLADLEFTYNDGLSELPGGAFEGLSNLRELHLRSNKGLTQLPDDAFDNLPNLRYLDLDFNALTELPDGLFDDLTNLEELSMIGNQFTELPDGLFDNLTSLEKLYVAKTQLTELPDGLFDNLTNLEGLSIGGQFTVLPDGLFDNLTNLEGLSVGGQFTELPDGLFDNLTNLEGLWVRGQLTALPEGLFDNLTGLTRVSLDDNPGAPFIFGLEIARNQEDIKVNVSSATPFDILLTLEAAGGSLSTPEVTLAAGGTTSDVITVTPDGDGAVAVRVVSAEFGALLAQGVAVGLGDPLILPNAQSDNQLATGAPTISGTAQVGQTLTASISAIEDQDGLTNVSYAHQWVTNDGTTDRDIVGATASTYTIGTSDLGQRIQVMVTFADDEENYEIATSGATEPVEAAPNVPATGKPVIVGDPIIPWDAPWSWRSTLSVDLSGVSDKNGMSGSDFSFTWRCVKEDGDYYCGIGYSSKPTFPIIRMFRGETIKVYVSFMDDGGNVETLESEPIGPVTYAPSPAEGAPVIGGIPRVGSWLLGGSHGIYDRNGITIHRSSFSYQWIVDNTDVDGETGHNYTVKSTDVGKTIKMRLSFTDDDGFAESLVSAPTAPVVAADSANSPATGAPLIRGSFRVGNTLRAITDYSSYIRDADGLIAPNFAYQWIRSNGNTDTDIEDATESTYELTDDDVGKTIKVQVFFNDDPGNQEALISALSATVVPVATDSANNPAQGTAAIVGTAQVGETLTVDTSGISDQDGMENATYSFTWRANDIEGDGGLLRGGGLATTYMVQPGDAGKTLTAHWYFVDDQGNQESGTVETTTVLATVPDPPENLRVTPSETGELDIQWDAPWWDLDSLQDSGAVGDGGSPITSYTVQWKKAGGSWDAPQDVSEATATDTSHNIATGLELEVEYTVRVFATNAVGNGAASDEVAATAVAQSSEHRAGTQNKPATGLPNITGTPLAGETLTADTSSIEDPDGMTTPVFRYQWLMTGADSETEIEVASTSTYTLPDDYVGNPIRVKVSFTDDAGNEEVLTSHGVAGLIVTISNSPATGLPTINGTAKVGETLTADTSAVADEDGLTNVSYRYQWLVDDANIQGTTNFTYTLADSDEGKIIKVKVSFTDDTENEETLTSAATAAVAPRSDNTMEDEAAPVWSADMLVVEYSSVSIGAASTDLFSNVGGSGGLQIKSLWSYTPGRDLRLAFEEAVPCGLDPESRRSVAGISGREFRRKQL